jgi:hypothetical protein
MAETFKDLGVCDQLVEACENLGWKIPSKIQAEVIPHALNGSFSYFLDLSLSHCVSISLVLLSFSVSSIDLMSFSYISRQSSGVYDCSIYFNFMCWSA